MSNQPPKHFIVIVPGYMGSLLRNQKTKEPVWIDLPRLLKNPLKIGAAIDSMLDQMMYPNPNLEPYGIMETGVLYVLPWARLDHYGRLIQVLKGLGYQIEPQIPDPDKPAVYKFPYDWRQDNTTSAQQLGAAVEIWRKRHPGAEVWLIGHSNGGIVSRWYVENEGGKNVVTRQFLMGSPWDGAPKSMKVLLNGMDIVGRLSLNHFGLGQRMKDLIRSFPSYYQLVPHANPFLTDTHNQTLDPYADMRWLSNASDRQKLQKSADFYQALDGKYSIETVCFVGTKKRTTSSGLVQLGPAGTYDKVTWNESLVGDGTVPERSAVHPGIHDVYAYWVEHGSIYVDKAMLAQLERELFGKYQTPGDRAALVTERLSIVFEPEKAFYAPGETVDLWATIHSTKPGEPQVSEAEVRVSTRWQEPLPGDEGVPAPAAAQPEVRLWEDENTPGRYVGQLTAPLQEGFYQLNATVEVTGEPAFSLEEAIAVEAA